MKVLAVCLLFFGLFLYGEARSLQHSGCSTEDWDFLMLVTEWPFSSCEQQNATHGHECQIPDVVKGWTIHGLWPSCNNGKYPQYCSDDKFDFSKVEDLNDRLMADWPNLFVDESKTSFWKHEYEKHGTCAAGLTSLDNEHKFFSVTLDLRDKYDMDRVLGDQGITPDLKPYQGAKVKDAINNGLNARGCSSCKRVKDIGYVLMSTVVCLNRDLELIDCPYCEQECMDSDEVFYQPMIR